jgi:hypothetical protein
MEQDTEVENITLNQAIRAMKGLKKGLYLARSQRRYVDADAIQHQILEYKEAFRYLKNN